MKKNKVAMGNGKYRITLDLLQHEMDHVETQANTTGATYAAVIRSSLDWTSVLGRLTSGEDTLNIVLNGVHMILTVPRELRVPKVEAE